MAKRVSEEQTSNVTEDVIASFSIEMNTAQRDIDEATGRKRSIIKRAKSAGIDTDTMGKVLAAKKKDEEAFGLEMRTFIRYASVVAPHLPLSQSDLFGSGAPVPVAAKTSAVVQLADANEQGYQAGLAGGSKEDCAAAPGTPVNHAFVEGWLRGQRVLADRLAANGEEGATKVASTSRTKSRGKKAAAADDTEEAVDPRQDDLETAISRGTA